MRAKLSCFSCNVTPAAGNRLKSYSLATGCGAAGVYGATGHELSAATARASVLYDRENDIIVDASIDRLNMDERRLGKGYIEAFRGMDFGERKALVLCDRGYPFQDFIGYLEGNGIKYVMRVPHGFNRRIDRLGMGSERISLANGIQTRAVVFQLKSREREALVTNVPEEEMEDAAFPDLYYKRWSAETKYQQVKQKLELENFSGRLVDHIKQDFYAMMMVWNMLSSVLREAHEKVPKEQTKKRQYAYRAHENHAVGVLKDRLIGILIAEDLFTRQCLYGELVSEIRRRVVPLRTNCEVPRKEYVKKLHFYHNHKSNC